MERFDQPLPDGRQRYLVRGRVLVSTSSNTVHFLDDASRAVTPLYSEVVPMGYRLVFIVELHGRLTFEADTEVQITELPPAKVGTFDPDMYRLVRAPGPEPVVTSYGDKLPNGSAVSWLMTFDNGRKQRWLHPTGGSAAWRLGDTTPTFLLQLGFSPIL